MRPGVLSSRLAGQAVSAGVVPSNNRHSLPTGPYSPGAAGTITKNYPACGWAKRGALAQLLLVVRDRGRQRSRI